jgi:hypothetical protein
MRIHLIILSVLWLAGCSASYHPPLLLKCQSPSVPVTGYAKAFVGEDRIKHATISILETNQSFFTNEQGQFGFCALPNQRITLSLEKHSQNPLHNYQTTQEGTFYIPKIGFQGANNEITFQVPRKITYHLLQTILKSQRHTNPCIDCCNVATTITAHKKTLADDIQGEVGARITLRHHGKTISHRGLLYFGILFGKTNPFDISGTTSSEDGGVLIYNLPASRDLYTTSATKNGFYFSSEKFWCRKGAFINLSPPHGPRVE